MTNKALLQTASARLQNAAYSPKKLIFLHAGISLLATFLGSLASYLMTNSMDAATGLSGLDTRTFLSFFRTLLLLVTAIALPFWDLGYIRCGVLYAKNETPTPSDLLCGFRRIFPALRMLFLQLLAVFAVLFFSLQVSMMLFMFSPFSIPLMQKLEGLVTAETVMTEELVQQLMPSLVPVYILWGVVVLAVLIPLFYRFRLAEFHLMADAPGAIAAFRQSARTTKRKCLQLFRLDLHFWWYYGLSLLCGAVSYLDVILPRLGVAVNADVAFWVFFLLGQLLSLALHIFCTPKVQTSYALFAQGSSHS